MQQQYNIHQLRYLSNTVLYALSARPLVDTRPDNPEHRNRITSSPVRNPGSPNTSIPETKRMLAISPAHAGLELPLLGVLIYETQVRAWLAGITTGTVRDIDHLIRAVRIAKSDYRELPKLWHPVGHSTNGWYCRPNYNTNKRVRLAILYLLNSVLEAGNVKPIGSDHPELVKS